MRHFSPLAVVLVLAAAPAARAQPAAPGAALDRGPHAVGFRVITLLDPSRPSRPTGSKPPEGQAESQDRARRLQLHVWYPAASPAGDPAMTIGDYVAASEPAGPGAGAGFAAQYRQTLPRMLGVPFGDSEWQRYTAMPMTARRDAPAAAGQFPLLMGVLREVSVALTSESLASHGYVVAFVQPPADQIDADGLVLEALTMAQHVRDMEMAIARMRAEPGVHPGRLGAIGFSGSGLAQLVLAMRHADVDAVVQLETGYFSPAGASSYQEVDAYDTAALKVPMFFAYSESLGRNTDLQLAEIGRMRYAPRYLLYLGEPRMGHWDFATEGIAAIELGLRPDARGGVLRAFTAIQRYQRAFLDAFVKRDAGAVARLNEPPPASGGALIELRAHPAIVPAISRRAFRALLNSDPPRAMQAAREGLARDPRAAIFDEAWLNALGYELLQAGQRDRSLDIFRLAAEAHPSSANTADSFSEALESAGERAGALEWARKALALLPADRTVPPAQRGPLEAGLKARIARLGGAGPWTPGVL